MMEISDIRTAFQSVFGEFPEDARPKLASELGLQLHQVGYAFDNDSCYFIVNTDDGVFVVDGSKENIVVRDIK